MRTLDTIFALSSGRPPAAVGLIRISGPQAHAAASRIAGDLPVPRVASVRELRDPATDELLDQALVLRFNGPASATGEDVVEFHCHGGRAVVEVVLSRLAAIDGLRQARPGEFTRRAFESGRIDLSEAEGLADLLEAETESQRKAALAIAEGGLRRQIEQWQARLLELSAIAELAIDYDDVDEALDPEFIASCDALASDLEQWLCRPRVEPLKDGLLIVVAGPPNAGKSSLVNLVAGEERSIVTDVPGTTRDHIEVPLSIAGIPVRLTDTAGLRAAEDEPEAIGVERARSLLKIADIVVWLGAATEAPVHPRLVLVHAKADLAGREEVPAGMIPVSALTGAGVAALLERLAELAGTILPGEGAIALNRRQADLIGAAQRSLRAAACATELSILAEELRHARSAFDRLTGRAGVENVLDALFARFCLGK
ncbi:tRNA uridine-5-carboxymethylaminomethyl(34) synthesis GTPase MnmE [Sphingomonas sp.]|uniref:tRNA uridine-5-carboxymethylaminomethyl(34) synthesis GTPase MnmE n=1 Tax=Sphingomonas sp. TaxID=28214 RepID=UPI0025DF50FD|nr:tRNA uridine-5-carboxymethylaminomethyl(34) synthesis GTPase MnmE [Sphingomonas sp.]MBV9527270.1 tRNA uridine-5-carboxymethylaminomethyl(34) synthesis GTPase MnmE [Sphingomonas sp.]